MLPQSRVTILACSASAETSGRPATRKPTRSCLLCEEAALPAPQAGGGDGDGGTHPPQPRLAAERGAGLTFSRCERVTYGTGSRAWLCWVIWTIGPTMSAKQKAEVKRVLPSPESKGESRGAPGPGPANPRYLPPASKPVLRPLSAVESLSRPHRLRGPVQSHLPPGCPGNGSPRSPFQPVSRLTPGQAHSVRAGYGFPVREQPAPFLFVLLLAVAAGCGLLAQTVQILQRDPRHHHTHTPGSDRRATPRRPCVIASSRHRPACPTPPSPPSLRLRRGRF